MPFERAHTFCESKNSRRIIKTFISRQKLIYLYSLSFEEKVVKGINVDITGRRSRCKKTRPLPAKDKIYKYIVEFVYSGKKKRI